MTIFDALLQLFLLSLSLSLVGLWQREKGKAIGWQEGYFGKAHDDRARRNHFGRFKAKDAPQHTWRAAK